MYAGINDFKKSYQQPITNIVRDKKGNLVTNSHSILVWWRKHFSQIFNVYEVSDVRHIEIHSAETQVSEPSAFEIEMAIQKLKSHTLTGADQIPAQIIRAGRRTSGSEIHKLIISTWNKVELPEERKQSIIVHIFKTATKQTVVITEAYRFCQLRTKFYPTSCSRG